MHISECRSTATGLALSFVLALLLCIGIHSIPAQANPTVSEQPAASQSLIDVVCEQADQAGAEVEAELEAERVAAAEAAKPDSVRRAEAAIGTPYRSGSSSPSGFDCSGLVSYCLTGNYGHAYTSYAFWGMPAVSDPQPGDVVACSPGHVGLYIGNGQMIHAPQSGEYVRIDPIRGKIVRP